MSLQKYGVLKGRPIGYRYGQGSSPHYQIHIVADDEYRTAINVMSQLPPSDLEYLVDDAFQHSLTADLKNIPSGFTPIESRPGCMGLDYIRGNLLDLNRMRALPCNVPGRDNDLNEAIDKHVQRAMADESASIYAFGERWGPETARDKYFGFQPGNGVHDIHMNQGNDPQFANQDGTWQDGGVLLHFPSQNQWVAIFLKFQSQTWHTDDQSGHRIDIPGPVEPAMVVRIVGALVNPIGPAPEAETVTLLNASPKAIVLDGWAIADRMKNKAPLDGTIESGGTRLIRLPRSVQLGNNGGIITLLNDKGLKVHGVAYTQEQARKEGWTVVF